MSERVEFRLPLPPARGNRRGGWKRHWRKDIVWEQHAQIEMARQKIRYPKQPFARVRVTLRYLVSARLAVDPDNLDFRCRKPILDLLKEHWYCRAKKTGRWARMSVPPSPKNKRAVRTKPGFFRDDSREYVELTPATSEIVEDPDDECVVVTIESIDGGEA